MTAARKQKHVWTPVQEFARRKEPSKFWRVDRNELAVYRCSCPSFIFGVKNGAVGVYKIPPHTTCKHVEWVQAHPDQLTGVRDALTIAHEEAVAAFAVSLETLFVDRVKAICETRLSPPLRDKPWTFARALDCANVFSTTGRDDWRAFAADVMMLTGGSIAVASSEMNGPVLGKRRIILPGD